MKHIIAFAFLATASSCVGSGTETDNPASPLKDFSSSECKNKELAPGQQALIAESAVAGLTCVEWERGAEGALALKVHNLGLPCGDTYLGKAGFSSDGALELSVYQDTCLVAKCGTCLFDFSYQLQGIDSERALELRVGSAVCDSEPTIYRDELALPIDEQDSGVVCRALERDYLSWYASGRGTCGSLNMPCGSPDCRSADQTSCDEGLTCSELGSGDSRCLPDCASDDDCLAGATTCIDGVCRPADGW